MAAISSTEFRRELREAAAERLAELLSAPGLTLDGPALRALFRNPFLSSARIAELFDLPEVTASYEARRQAAGDPRTPRTLALRCVTGLYWADLVRLGVDIRLHPAVRQAADRRLIERLPALAMGEKMAIGRSASAAVLSVLRFDPAPRVIGALLENPRTTEMLLIPLAASERASPQALSTIAHSPRWASRRALRSALCRNPAMPQQVALGLLAGLAKSDLMAVAADPRLPLALRRKAELLGGGSDSALRRRSAD